MSNESRCPKCGEENLRTWGQLSDDERAVVQRLPASADFPFPERRSRHRWCTRCWHEEIGGHDHTA